jgi:hypothetical protein
VITHATLIRTHVAGLRTAVPTTDPTPAGAIESVPSVRSERLRTTVPLVGVSARQIVVVAVGSADTRQRHEQRDPASLKMPVRRAQQVAGVAVASPFSERGVPSVTLLSLVTVPLVFVQSAVLKVLLVPGSRKVIAIGPQISRA